MIVPAPQNNGKVKYYVWPGERGHSAFTAVNKEQLEFAEMMKIAKNIP